MLAGRELYKFIQYNSLIHGSCLMHINIIQSKIEWTLYFSDGIIVLVDIS